MGTKTAIVVGVDFSEGSEAAIAAAIEHAVRMEAAIHVVHAFHIPLRFYTPYEIASPDAFLAEVAENAREKLDDVVARVRDAGVEAMPHLVDDSAANAIVEVAQRVAAKLIVVATRGHTGVKHALLGSVAERTTQLARCSVLIAKPRHEKATA